MLGNMVNRIAALPTWAKALLVVVALFIIGVLVVLSPLVVVLAFLALIVAVLALVVRVLRRRSLRRWGIIAATSLVVLLVFSGISNALYFSGGGQEQAGSQKKAAQRGESSPPREKSTAKETDSPPEKTKQAAGDSKPNPKPQPDLTKEEERSRFDAKATVTGVVDGDTIEITPAIDGEEDVRLIGVDTPETKDPDEGVEPYGEEASNYALTELQGEKVELEFDAEKKDQYGRLLAYVYPMDEEMFNQDLLEGGYAQVYTVSPNDKHEGKFEAAQDEARTGDSGIWGLSKDEQCELANRGNGIGEGSPGCVKDKEPAPQPAPKKDIDCDQVNGPIPVPPGDPNNLDGDGDGLACEDSSGGSTASPSASPSASPTASPNASPSPGNGAPDPNVPNPNVPNPSVPGDASPPPGGGCPPGAIPVPPGDPRDGDDDGCAGE